MVFVKARTSNGIDKKSIEIHQPNSYSYTDNFDTGIESPAI